MTKEMAVEMFIKETNGYPTDMIGELIEAHPEDWYEVTPPTLGDRVYDYEMRETGEIVGVEFDSQAGEDGEGETMYEISFGQGETVYDHRDDFEVERDCGLPFGIDGCGYSFKEAHWTPLYEKRGLHWHDDDETGKEEN